MENLPRRIIGEGKYLRLVAHGRWEFAERTRASGAVAILAVTSQRRLLLVEQYRPALGKNCIELPAGLVGDEDDEAEHMAIAAERELLEETGYQAAEMRLLTEGPPSPGLTSEVISFFQGIGLTKTGAGGGDHNEKIVVHEVPLTDVDRWLETKAGEGLAVDPKIYVGLYFYHRATA